MSLKLKELNEQRGAKLKQARAIIETAKTANRDFTAEERTQITGLHAEIEDLDANISIHIRQLAIESGRGQRLSGQEQRDIGRFDYNKLLNHLYRSAKGTAVAAIDGVEAEMIAEGEREARSSGIESGGVMLPRILVRRGNRDGVEFRDMTATGGTNGDQGGNTIVTEKRGLADDFFNASVMRSAGATVLEGLVGNLDLPRIVAGTAAGGKAENAAADEVSPTTAMLSLRPKRLPAYIDVGELLLKQSSSVSEAIIGNHLKTQMGATQEAAFFHGSGTNEAQGIAGTSGIGSVAGGTNGAAPVLTHLTGLEEKVDATNALLGNLHYVSNGQVRKKLKETPKVSGTDSKMLLEDTKGAALNGYDPLWTNAVSRTLTKGTASGVCSAIFFGNFTDYIVGYWGGVSLEMVRDKTNAISGLYTLVASSYYDGGVLRPKSFAAMLDALAA